MPAGSQLYFVYHAWIENGAGQHDTTTGRQVLVDRIDFVDNWPRIHDGSPSTEFLPWPGE